MIPHSRSLVAAAAHVSAPAYEPRSLSIASAPWSTLALFAVVALWPFVGLFGREPWKADEAYSFGLVWSMLQGKGWIVPMLGGEPFVEKPPLFYWTATVLARVFGGALSLPDAARLACAFYSILTLAAVAGAGRLATRARSAPWLAVVALVASVGLFEKLHLLVTDCALVAGFAVGLLGIGLARTRAVAGGLLLGVGASAALMSKGLLGPGVLGLTALALLAFPEWRTRSFGRAIAIAALTAVPAIAIWPALLWQQSPELFHEWFWRNNFGRFLGFARLGEHHHPWFYAVTLPWFAFPGWWFAAVGVRSALRKRAELASLLPSMLAFAIGFVVLSLAAEARSIYATILLVPLAPLAAAGIRELRGRIDGRWQRIPGIGFGTIVVALWLGWLVLQTGVPGSLATWLLARAPGFEPAIGPLATTVALLATASLVVVLRSAPQTAQGWLFRWTAGLAAAWTLLATLWLPYVDHGMAYRSVAQPLATAIPPDANCVASVRLGEPQRALFDYYAGIRTRRVEVDPDAVGVCDVLLVQALGRQDLPGPEWTQIWHGARPGDSQERFLLYRRLHQSASAMPPPPSVVRTGR